MCSECSSIQMLQSVPHMHRSALYVKQRKAMRKRKNHRLYRRCRSLSRNARRGFRSIGSVKGERQLMGVIKHSTKKGVFMQKTENKPQKTKENRPFHAHTQRGLYLGRPGRMGPQTGSSRCLMDQWFGAQALL